jgi:ketosteroid isomerase-like protein
MDNAEIIRTWNENFANRNADAFSDLFTEDFETVATNLPAPLMATQWIGFIKMLYAASSDLDFNWKLISDQDNEIMMSYQLTGTHDGTLAAAAVKMKDWEATGKSFSLPVDEYKLTITDGKISRIDVDPAEGAGLGGMVAQLELN